MAARRQDAWELQLKEKAFLVASIKPIVDGTITFKPTVPYALREVKRSMDKGVYFKDNTYGPAGLAGPAHATTMYEYGNWDQWARSVLLPECVLADVRAQVRSTQQPQEARLERPSSPPGPPRPSRPIARAPRDRTWRDGGRGGAPSLHLHPLPLVSYCPIHNK